MPFLQIYVTECLSPVNHQSKDVRCQTLKSCSTGKETENCWLHFASCISFATDNSGGSRISRGGGLDLVGGGAWAPEAVTFQKFVCQNERIWTCGGGGGAMASLSMFGNNNSSNNNCNVVVYRKQQHVTFKSLIYLIQFG